MTFTQEQKLELARAIDSLVHKDAVEYLRRERNGSSSSMNGALEYTSFRVVDAVEAFLQTLPAALKGE
jgi:hypothetical protein